MKLLLTLPFSGTTDHLSGINKDVFLDTNDGRTTYLNHVKNSLLAHPAMYDSIAYISPAEEWYVLMYQDYFGPVWHSPHGDVPGLNWLLFDQTDPWQDRELMKGYLHNFIEEVHAVFPGKPVVLIDNWWSTNPWNLFHPPLNVDVLGLDAYFIPTSSACDSTQQQRFGEVVAAYADAGGYGKPLMMVGNSAPFAGPMPSNCQLQWFKDLADSRGDIAAIVWWLYAHPVPGGTGLRDYPVQRDYLFQMGESIIAANVIGVIDTPAAEAVVSVGTNVGGWAIERAALQTGGINTIHVWAYPDPYNPATAVFLGWTTANADRPDVAAAFGSQFRFSGYNFPLPAQTPSGGFLLVVFAYSIETGSFTNVGVRHLTRQ